MIGTKRHDASERGEGAGAGSSDAPTPTWLDVVSRVLAPAFVVVSLLALLIAPVVLSRTEDAYRREVYEVTEPIRSQLRVIDVAVNMQAAAARGFAASPERRAEFEPMYRDARFEQSRSLAECRRLAELLGTISERDLHELEERVAGWQAGADRLFNGVMSPSQFAAQLAGRNLQLLEIHDAIDVLHADVRAEGIERRAQIAEIRALQLRVTVILSLFTLLSIVAVVILGRRSARLAEANLEKQRAQESAEYRAQALAYVSHDLRTPLSTVLTGVDQLEDAFESGDRKHFERLGRITHSAAEKMQRLVDDLLQAARIQAGHRLVIHRAPTDLRALLRRSCEQFAVQKHRVKVIDRVPESLPLFLLDGHIIERAISNLVTNAASVSPMSSVVRVEVELEGDRLEICVADDGPGISVADRDHLFDPFWRSSLPGGRGFGLGLAIVKGAAEAHGGRVTVESTIGAGSTFRISLPAVRAEDTGEPTDEAPATEPPADRADDEGDRRPVLRDVSHRR